MISNLRFEIPRDASFKYNKITKETKSLGEITVVQLCMYYSNMSIQLEFSDPKHLIYFSKMARLASIVFDNASATDSIVELEGVPEEVQEEVVD